MTNNFLNIVKILYVYACNKCTDLKHKKSIHPKRIGRQFY